MGKKKKNNPKQNRTEAQKEPISKEDLYKPWISMRSGIRIIAVTSLAMAGMTAWQVAPELGWLEASGWGLLFGALIWVIFFGFYYFRRMLQR